MLFSFLVRFIVLGNFLSENPNSSTNTIVHPQCSLYMIFFHLLVPFYYIFCNVAIHVSLFFSYELHFYFLFPVALIGRGNFLLKNSNKSFLIHDLRYFLSCILSLLFISLCAFYFFSPFTCTSL